MRLIVTIVSLILFSSWITNRNSYDNFETNDLPKSKIPLFNQESVDSIPSILRIGVMTPKYILGPYDPFFDPIAIGWNADLRRNSLVYEALVHYDPYSGGLQPMLAEQWVVSKDSKHWTFYLRDDIIFHDGSKFNASTVKWNYDRLINPTHSAYVKPAPYISFHTIPFDFVEIENEFQVTVHLTDPFAAFIHECAYLHIAAPTSFIGPNISHPIGTGPYELTSSTYNDNFQNFTFTRFNNYHQGLAPFEQIHYLAQEEFADEIRDQTVDMVFMHNTIEEQLLNSINWEVYISEKMTRFELMYINHNNQYLSDPRVRLAINYAIDRQEYINQMNWSDFSIPMTNLIPPDVPYYNQSVTGYPFDVALANELLDKAGYLRGKDNFRFALNLVGDESRHPEIIEEYLEAIGIWAPPNIPSDWAEYWREGDYDLILFGSSSYNDPDLTRLYLHSSSPFNTGGFEEPLIDELVLKGAKTPVRQEREYFYYRVQPVIQQKAPYIYLTFNKNIYALIKDLNPFVFVNTIEQIYFNYSTQDNQLLGNFKLSQQQVEASNSHKQSLYPEKFQYNNIEVTDYPIYFPWADCVLTPLQEQKYHVNITMSKELKVFLPSEIEDGKFILATSDQENKNYLLRCYYDIEEVNEIPHDQLALFLYNEERGEWEELKIQASNSTFRYLEVELSGKRNLIQFNIPNFLKTYKLVPFFAIAIGGLVVCAVSIVIYNYRKAKYIRGRILK